MPRSANPKQAHKHFDAGKLIELAESMAANGLAVPIEIQQWCEESHQICEAAKARLSELRNQVDRSGDVGELLALQATLTELQTRFAEHRLRGDRLAGQVMSEMGIASS